ncbi:MAG: 16S rRNA (adenine(1518)-N(6)/adenine(1519)-N(6))-dimethyltransferase RsmA [Clostridia bacterium]|nr:16S rRNA (adenine(1518)-N(6)/adenine(1519)-N(6))-dimethyltransferase RsmA [Clostridia bacterium]
MKDFKFLKKYGQNFLSDKNLLRAIVDDALVSKEDVVLEVGPGAGALTEPLLEKAKSVVSVEIDDRLISELKEKFEKFDNFTLVHNDIMKVSDEEIRSLVGDNFKVVANIPYYISTQLIMRFLESTIKAKSVTVMVQKEVAERLTAKAGDKEYGVISVAVALYGHARITRQVNRKMFYPVPDVDSAVVTVEVDENRNCDIKGVLKLVRAAFSMRRKTLRNNLLSNYGVKGEDFDSVITEMGFDTAIRGEKLSPQDFIALYEKLK